MKIGDAQLHYIWTMCTKFEWNLLSGITNKLGTNCVDGQVQPNPQNEKKSNFYKYQNISMKIGGAQLHHIWKICIYTVWMNSVERY